MVSGTAFEESGCKIFLPEGRKWIVLSGTLYAANHGFSAKLCDLLLFGMDGTGKSFAAAIELKGGRFDVEHVREQLQNGAFLLEQLIDAGDKAKISFLPALLHRRISQPIIVFRELDLPKNRVRFRGAVFRIVPLKCGSEVTVRAWNPLRT